MLRRMIVVTANDRTNEQRPHEQTALAEKVKHALHEVRIGREWKRDDHSVGKERKADFENQTFRRQHVDDVVWNWRRFRLLNGLQANIRKRFVRGIGKHPEILYVTIAVNGKRNP